MLLQQLQSLGPTLWTPGNSSLQRLLGNSSGNPVSNPPQIRAMPAVNTPLSLATITAAIATLLTVHTISPNAMPASANFVLSSNNCRAVLVAWSAIDKKDADLDVLTHPLLNLIYYTVVEIIPAALVLYILRKLPPKKQPQGYQPIPAVAQPPAAKAGNVPTTGPSASQA